MVTVGQNRHRVEMGPDFQVMMETFDNFWTAIRRTLHPRIFSWFQKVLETILDKLL